MGIPLSARVKEYQGKPGLFINEQLVNPMFYALTDVPGGRWTWEEIPNRNIRLFAENGFNLFQVDLFLDHIWFADGTFDIEMARKQIRPLIDIRPDAAVMIRFHVNAPKWWRDAHPEEWVHYADVPVTIDDEWGLRRIIEYDVPPTNRVSLASKKWRQVASNQLIKFCQELSKTPEGDALIGLQLACGVYGEWHYFGFFHAEPDTGPAMTSYFRQWLKEKYGSDLLLQTAWNRSLGTLATAEVPNLEERIHPTAGIFRNPLNERNVIDYYECQHQVVADDIVHFCQVAKQHWPRPIITAAFYGYFYSLFGRQAAGGHLALERVLNSEFVDCLCAPQAYFPLSVEPGNAYRSRSLIESIRLHGKLWLDEMDSKPDIHWDLEQIKYQGDLAKSLGPLRRNMFSSFSRGMGLWFYDFGLAWAHSGWWDHPSLMAEIKQVKYLLDAHIDKPFQSDADVLLVYDTHIFYHLADRLTYSLVYNSIDEVTPMVSFSGVIADPIHIMDLERVDISRYKAIIFGNTFLLSQKQKTFIHEKVAQQGRHLIWLYAPGYADGQSLDVQHISDTTGISVEKVILSIVPEVLVDIPSLANVKIGINVTSLDPLFVVDDSSVDTLGHLADTKKTALARKKLANSTSWYCSLPINQAEIWRHILKEAGAHIYAEDGDVFYAGRGILGVHTKDGGKRTLHLKNGKTVQLELAPFSTTFLDNNTGKILL